MFKYKDNHTFGAIQRHYALSFSLLQFNVILVASSDGKWADAQPLLHSLTVFSAKNRYI